MEFFNQTYVALRGPTGAPQTASDTIGRLSDRLSPSTLLAERRVALKSLSWDCKADVGASALPGLLDVFHNDAEVDSDIGKAVLETLNILCDVDDQGKDIAGFNQSKDIGFRHTDTVLVNDKTAHALDIAAESVQQYFLTAKSGATGIISVLEDKREIIRNEAITMIQALGSTRRRERQLDCSAGGADSYFHETGLPPALCELLLFPINLAMNEAAPREFALQFWDPQKMADAGYPIMGMLINSKGSALHLLPSSLNSLLSEISLTPVPETNGEERDRLEPASAPDALVELALHGECNGLDGGKRLKDGLELLAYSVFPAQIVLELCSKPLFKPWFYLNISPHDIPPTSLLIALGSALDTSSLSLDPTVVTSMHLETFLFSLISCAAHSKPGRLLWSLCPVRNLQVVNSLAPADGAPSAEAEDDDSRVYEFNREPGRLQAIEDRLRPKPLLEARKQAIEGTGESSVYQE
ncbi:hypothetical protein C8J56DRAFT_886782 [Mycena floridula]|nr:hypothetical protein C8J56DRAFT_886782 [Mycena floridula]